MWSEIHVCSWTYVIAANLRRYLHTRTRLMQDHANTKVAACRGGRNDGDYLGSFGRANLLRAVDTMAVQKNAVPVTSAPIWRKTLFGSKLWVTERGGVFPINVLKIWAHVHGKWIYTTFTKVAARRLIVGFIYRFSVLWILHTSSPFF